MEQNDNDALIEAVTYHQVAKVKSLLQQGADPNYFFVRSADMDNGLHQPNTPLRTTIFCISDSLLEGKDLQEHAEIAKLLLQYGADPKPAVALAESRYGKYDPKYHDSDDPSWEVYRIIATAKRYLQKTETSACILPNDDPNNQPGSYHWGWFKKHHFTALEQHYTALYEQSNRLPAKVAYSQEEIEIFLNHLKAIVALHKYLPRADSVWYTMEQIVESAESYENNYLNKEQNPGSYWDSDRIIREVFMVYNYMRICCED